MCMVEQNNTERIPGLVETTERISSDAFTRLNGACFVPKVSNDNRRMYDSILTLPCLEPRSLRTNVPAIY